MYIKVTVQPESKKESVVMKNDRYVVSVKARAQEGMANEAARKLLADHLGVPEGKLALVRGSDKPSKLFMLYES